MEVPHADNPIHAADPLGVYLSVPFCRAKCSFCNFASGVFARERLEGYLGGVAAEMQAAQAWAETLGVAFERSVDTLYLGGGTPSILEPAQVRTLFSALHGQFQVLAGAEITLEAAPGQLSDATLFALVEAGVNRLSFGVQSFIDRESHAVGRLHTAAECHREICRVLAAGIPRVAIDLIVGLPWQTWASLQTSLEQALASGAEHVSLYLLELDEDSRLGREALAGGTRFGADALPSEEATADWYVAACELLEAGGLAQYEISNFARPGAHSRHNRRYWERRGYLGFGLDAHSMLRQGRGGVRWANGDTFERIAERSIDRVGLREAFEESIFLGLRLVEGVCQRQLRDDFGDWVDDLLAPVDECVEAGLMQADTWRWKLTASGRMASNEVFGRLLAGAAVAGGTAATEEKR